MDSDEDAHHRDELDGSDRHRSVEERVGVASALPHRQRRGPVPAEIAECREEPEQPRGRSDLPSRYEVRHVTLEWPLGEVGAELEQGHEGPDGEQAVGRGDAVQENHIQRGPDEDVGLAPAPAGHGVVADGPDGRLDGDGDDRPHQRDLKGAESLRSLGGQAGELDPAVDDVEDAAPHGGDAEPVEGDPDQLRPRKQPGRPAVRVVGGRDCGLDGRHVAHRFDSVSGVEHRPAPPLGPNRSALRHIRRRSGPSGRIGNCRCQYRRSGASSRGGLARCGNPPAECRRVPGLEWWRTPPPAF